MNFINKQLPLDRTNSLWILPNNPLLRAGVFSTCNTHQDFSPTPFFFPNSVTARRTNLTVLVLCIVQATTCSLFTRDVQYNINLPNSCIQMYFKTIRSVTLSFLDKEVLVKVNLPFSLLHPSCVHFTYFSILRYWLQLSPSQCWQTLHTELCSSTLLENKVKKYHKTPHVLLLRNLTNGMGSNVHTAHLLLHFCYRNWKANSHQGTEAGTQKQPAHGMLCQTPCSNQQYCFVLYTFMSRLIWTSLNLD